MAREGGKEEEKEKEKEMEKEREEEEAYVINEEDSDSRSEVGSGDCAKPLLAGCVPNLSSNN